MDIPNLRAFVTVSREGGVGRAAESLGLTSSPISRSIRELEREMGFSLFARNYHTMDLTEEGHKFLPRAVDVLLRFDDLSREHPRALRAGCTPWTSRRHHEYLTEFVTAAGGKVENDDDSIVLMHRVTHGELDTAIVYGPIDEPGISSEVLGTTGMLVRSTTKLSDRSTIRLADLAGQKLVSMPYTYAPWVKRVLSEQYGRAGVGFPETLSFGDVMTIEARLHRTGELLIMTTATDVPLNDFVSRVDLHTVEIDRADISSELALVWRTAECARRDQMLELAAGLRGDAHAG